MRGAGSIASSRPAGPTLRANGTVHSPRLAPTSITTEPGCRNPRTAGWTCGGWSRAWRPRASSGLGTCTRSPVRCSTSPPGQSRSIRVRRRFSRQRRIRRAPGASGSPGGRSFQSAFRSVIMARRSPGSCRRFLMPMSDLTGRVAVVQERLGWATIRNGSAAGAAAAVQLRGRPRPRAAISLPIARAAPLRAQIRRRPNIRSSGCGRPRDRPP